MRNLLTIALAALGIMAANAANFDFDNGVVEIGKTYQVPSMSSISGTLTPSSSGVMLQTGCPEAMLYLNDKEMKYTAVGRDGAYQILSWNVEAGVTYTVKASFVFDGGPLTYQMEADQTYEVKEIQPAEGSEVSTFVNSTGEIIVRFSLGTHCTSASFVVGESSIALNPTQFSSNTLAVNIKSAMNSCYRSGLLDVEGGTPFSIKFTGIESTNGILLNGDGNLTLNYIASSKAIDLLSANFTDMRTLKSYYAADDAEGVLTMVFDHEIANDGKTFATLGAGDIESDNYYYEVLEPKIDGATLTLDLTGKLRDLNSYLYDNLVGLKVHNVRDTKGNYSAGNNVGNLGSYSYTLIYDYIKPADIASEFLPMSGESIKNTKEIEIWFNHSDMISYDGVLFSYVDGNESKEIVVAKENLEIEVTNSAASPETVILVQVPEEVKGKKVTVTLNNMVSYDGYDHTSQVRAYYDQFVVTLLAPIKEGTSIANTGTADFTVKVNGTPKYMRYDFYNMKTTAHPDGWSYGAEFEEDGSNRWSAPNPDIACYNDFVPKMVVRAYESKYAYEENAENVMGEFAFTFLGTSMPFQNSGTTFGAIVPVAGSTVDTTADDLCFKAYFDGYVAIDAAKSGILTDAGLQPFENVTTSNTAGDPTGYSATWLLYPGKALKNYTGKFAVQFVARDMSGKLVKGNMGLGDRDYRSIEYTAEGEAGIDGIVSDSASGCKVYNMQGVKVLEAESASALSTLRPGLYIVNGKKVMIK